MTAPGTIREDINSQVAREAYSDFDLASAHESFCEYRKYMNPRFPRQTIRASMTMHPSVTADSDEVARITPPTIHPARGFALDTGNRLRYEPMLDPLEGSRGSARRGFFRSRPTCWVLRQALPL